MKKEKKPKRKNGQKKNALHDGEEDVMQEIPDAKKAIEEEASPEAMSTREAEVAAIQPDEDEDLDDGPPKASSIVLLRSNDSHY